MWDALQQRFTRAREDGIMQDITDGSAYQKNLDFLSNPAHVSFTMNTDGVAIFKSSKVSVWPVWLMINELPKTIRLAE